MKTQHFKVLMPINRRISYLNGSTTTFPEANLKQGLYLLARFYHDSSREFKFRNNVKF